MSKVTKHTVPELREIPVPYRRFTEVNLNIVGPLPPSQGFRYLLMMSELLLILLGLRSAPQESDTISSFERTFGVSPILPSDFWGLPETPEQRVPHGVPAGHRGLHHPAPARTGQFHQLFLMTCPAASSCLLEWMAPAVLL